MSLLNQLHEYYNNFFNDNYLRDFRLISENKYNTDRPFIRSVKPEDNMKLLKRILRKDNANTNIYSEIYPFKNWGEFTKNRKQSRLKKSKKNYDFSNDKPVRIYDRLYFDFDLEKNNELGNLKKDINTAIKSNDMSTKKGLVKDYHNALLNKEVAKEPFSELVKLHTYLSNQGIKSYPLFSGAKGFHLYVFFKPSLFDPVAFNNIAKGVFDLFKNSLKLKTLDENVFNNPSQRVSRLPYFKHPVTELYTYPISVDNSYTSIIEYATKPKVELFSILEHTSNNGNIELLEYIKSNVKEENQKQKRIAKLEVERKQLQKEIDLEKAKNRPKGYKEVEKDCIKIANEFLGAPEKTFSNYVTYKCFNHNDNYPSLTVYKERFYCGVCGFNLNYLDFVMMYDNVNEKEAMKILLNRM